MIPDVLPERWKLCKPSNQTNGHWSHAELIEAFAKLSNQPIMLKNVCFFIDGLDEYDGDHKSLIRLLRSFSRPKNIKICASSRPWNVFKRAFETGSHTMLRLEDLTRNDIALYIRETLAQNELFNQLRKRENAHCVDLVNEVVSKAQGVFLWVFLVVRSLLTGLTNADRITDLRRRLGLLPADLESLFAHMLATIDTFYGQQTAQTFKIALHESKPQIIITYVMLDELDEDPQFALHLDIREWQSNEIRSKTESMELRINARGMGLLEVVRSKDSDGLGGDEVDFLHRTVRDFFRLEAPEDWIARRLPPSFNPDQLLCNAILARIKTMSVDLGQDPGKLFGLVDDMMRYAYSLEIDLEISPTILLDDLSHTLSQHIQAYAELPLWDLPPRDHNFNRIQQWRTSFLSFAVQKDLKLYVAEKLDTRSCSARGEDAYLICRALRPDISKALSGNRAMLRLLFQKGMCMTKANNSWRVLFSEIADGWAEAPDEEKILQIETINTLLVARENPREAFDYECWTSSLNKLPQNWLTGSIELQRALKTTMSLLLETVSGSGSVDGKSILWRTVMSEIKDALKRRDIGLASMDIILETMEIFVQHGASLDSNHINVILVLWRNPYYSTEQKAAFRAMFPDDFINNLSLPYRLHPPLGQTLDNPEQSLKRPAPDSGFDSETGSPDQTPSKRSFKRIPTPCPPDTGDSWLDTVVLPTSPLSPSNR